MVRLDKDQLKVLKELEGWDDEVFEELQKNWMEDPVYIWGGKDETEAKEEFRKKGYRWETDKDLDQFDPGWTWGYPVVVFIEKGGILSYTPVDYGRDTDTEPPF